MRTRARVKSNVVPIRTEKSVAEPRAGNHPIGTAGTEALCLEVPIRVMGFRLATGANGEVVKGDSFQEETSTMLLFARGAVIRLAEPVERGQDLLLVNKRTNKYVHCRTKNLRTSPEAKSYVEIEFTHTAAEFWGISFPKEAPLPAAFAPGTPARITAAPVPEALHETPAKTLAAAAGAVASPSAPASPGAATEISVGFGAGAPTPLAEWHDAAPATDYFAAPPPGVTAYAAENAEGGAPPQRIHFLSLESLIIPEKRSNRTRLAGMAVAALCAMVVGYRLLAPAGPDASIAAEMAASAAGGSGVLPGAEALAAAALAGQRAAGSTTVQGSQTAENPAIGRWESPGAVSAEAPEMAPVEAPRKLTVLVTKMDLPVQAVTLGPREAPEVAASAGGNAPGGTPALLAAPGKLPPPPPEPEPSPQAAAPVADALTPARLALSVPPSSPLLAKQAHIEGNVALEVQIDASGKVTGARVISGPQALRQAALDAVARWRFDPALLRNQPTASTTNVTLRFLLH